MTAPRLKGLHHVKLPVSDLDRSLAWYTRVLGAHHQVMFDHYDEHGTCYAVILSMAGLDVPLELRWAPRAARSMNGYDPVSFAAGGPADLAAWVEHLDAEEVAHSPISRGGAGELLVLADPDGTFLRLLEMPPGGLADIEMTTSIPEPDGPWIAPAVMRHPARPAGQGAQR